MITILSMVFVFGLLVFIHEFGHFLVAKSLGVRVERFSLGFGPRLMSFKRGFTEYMICILPLGGYVKLGGDEVGVELKKEPWEFLSRSPWQRNLVVLAGPLMNLLLAAVLFSAIFMVGVPMFTSKIGEVKKGFPAEQAGLKAGETIVSIGSQSVQAWEDLVEVIYASAGKELTLRVEGATGQTRTVLVTPREEVMKDIFGRENKLGIIGITPASEVLAKKMSFLPAIWAGTKATGTMTWLTYKGLWLLVTRQIPANSIGGPLMIAKLAGDSAKQGLLQLLHFTCIISVTLAVINLLPVPVLDGGHLMFFTIEGFKGRPVSLKTQEVSQKVGVALLLGLMVFATYNDIVRFVQ